MTFVPKGVAIPGTTPSFRPENQAEAEHRPEAME